ncbi:hypothetical protein ACFX1R_044431 [Malus domestica]
MCSSKLVASSSKGDQKEKIGRVCFNRVGGGRLCVVEELVIGYSEGVAMGMWWRQGYPLRMGLIGWWRCYPMTWHWSLLMGGGECESLQVCQTSGSG